jgi:outer membrane protein
LLPFGVVSARHALRVDAIRQDFSDGGNPNRATSSPARGSYTKMSGGLPIKRRIGVPVSLLFFLKIASAAQAPKTQPKVFTVQQAIDYALTHYPAVRAALERYNAARAGVGLARTNYVPFMDGVWESDRETRESVLGVLLPQSPTILTGTQGTVTPGPAEPFWTTGMGFLLSWQPFTFGYRRAELRSAHATENRTSAQVTLTQLGVASAVANASLAVLAREQTVQASQADVNRRTVFDRSVHALVNAQLRPGADASRADAELAAARTRLIEAEDARDVATAALAEALGMAGSTVEIMPTPFLQTPPESTWPEMPLTSHPAAVVQQRTIQEIQSRISVLNHTFYPHLTLNGLQQWRGSGQQKTGVITPGLQGLEPTIQNWAAGLSVQMNFSQFFSLRERKKIELANARRQEALYDLTIQNLTGQMQQALASVDGARRVAQNTPIELAAARQSEAQARARFQAGVGTIVDVAEAQSLLVQAEIDDSLARLSIWRALAQLAADEGNLTPFLNLAGSMGP